MIVRGLVVGWPLGLVPRTFILASVSTLSVVSVSQESEREGGR
jgi:hypothetical protein